MSRFVLSAAAGELRLQFASVSHVGVVRRANEDAVLVEPPIFAIADGMGGHLFGARASSAAVETLREDFESGAPVTVGQVLASIRRAHAVVRGLTAPAMHDRQIAGTTLTGVALVVEHSGAVPRWMVFNIGDSRVYRWLGTALGLDRVSVDHSVVQELLDAGMIDEDGARQHPERNVITRALGAVDEPQAEAWLISATEPQTFLICSDGLTKDLDDRQIAELLASREPEETPDATVARLLSAALAAGGGDNVSILLLRCEYAAVVSARHDVDEQTHERGQCELSPELGETRPRA